MILRFVHSLMIRLAFSRATSAKAAKSSWRILCRIRSSSGVPVGSPKCFANCNQGACDACLEGKKACGRHLVIGLSHSLDENGDEVTVKPRIVTPNI